MNYRFTILLVALACIGLHNSSQAQSRFISFSGYEWEVKDYSYKVGPGPNYFSDSSRNVWVDSLGRLHMKIERRKGKWRCAEVIGTESLGYGTYRFYLDTDVSGLDPNVVLGLFTWSNTPDFNNREIDIEFSRWGDPDADNAQYVVQPYYFEYNWWRYFLPADIDLSTHSFTWSPTEVHFQSLAGHLSSPGSSGDIIAEYLNDGPDIPLAGDETPRINLWLRQGLRPMNKKSVEIVISKFEFDPISN